MTDPLYRGFAEVKAEEWPQAKRMVVWSFEGCKSVTDALGQAAQYFEEKMGECPRFGFVRKMPGEDAFRDVGPLMVMEAEWMVEGAVAVGG